MRSEYCPSLKRHKSRQLTEAFPDSLRCRISCHVNLEQLSTVQPDYDDALSGAT